MGDESSICNHGNSSLSPEDREEKDRQVQAPPIGPVRSCGGELEAAEGYRLAGAAQVQGKGAHAQHWVWLQQKDTPHPPGWLQKVPSPPRGCPRAPPYVQP